ncbi:hypothetical protein COU61_04890 [Candidatus Pacearchaeota archaeon CG10_big_fil_rev_8_21_14_0_10_35_13]|nr:MAG: hypothetical protein COU61_04890 [Candidatus Pacearchaeota archaeon CG10_big_fil_rev_8_21_14_0_10_35_13]
MKDSETEVKICPKCGSTEIMIGISTSWGAASNYCKKCKYGKMLDGTNTLFPTIKINEIERFKEHLEEIR